MREEIPDIKKIPAPLRESVIGRIDKLLPKVKKAKELFNQMIKDEEGVGVKTAKRLLTMAVLSSLQTFIILFFDRLLQADNIKLFGGFI